jgi:hypothetical protein
MQPSNKNLQKEDIVLWIHHILVISLGKYADLTIAVLELFIMTVQLLLWLIFSVGLTLT